MSGGAGMGNFLDSESDLADWQKIRADSGGFGRIQVDSGGFGWIRAGSFCVFWFHYPWYYKMICRDNFVIYGVLISNFFFQVIFKYRLFWDECIGWTGRKIWGPFVQMFQGDLAYRSLNYIFRLVRAWDLSHRFLMPWFRCLQGVCYIWLNSFWMGEFWWVQFSARRWWLVGVLVGNFTIFKFILV